MQNTLEIIKVVHPGKFLEQELLKQNINKRQFAIAIGEYPQTLGSIIKGNRRMNVELSLKIEEKLKLEEGFLMTLQVFYNLKQAKKKNRNYSVHLKKNIVINNFFSVFKKTAILLTVLITYW